MSRAALKHFCDAENSYANYAASRLFHDRVLTGSDAADAEGADVPSSALLPALRLSSSGVGDDIDARIPLPLTTRLSAAVSTTGDGCGE